MIFLKSFKSSMTCRKLRIDIGFTATFVSLSKFCHQNEKPIIYQQLKRKVP